MRKHTNKTLVRLDGATWRRTFAGEVQAGTAIRLHTPVTGSDGLHLGYAPARGFAGGYAK